MRLSFTLNGQAVEREVDPTERVLDLLREEFRADRDPRRGAARANVAPARCSSMANW